MCKVAFKLFFNNNPLKRLLFILGINENKWINFIFDLIGYSVFMLPIMGLCCETTLKNEKNIDIINYPLLAYTTIFFTLILSITVIKKDFSVFFRIITVYEKNILLKFISLLKITFSGIPLILSIIFIIFTPLFIYSYNLPILPNIIYGLISIAILIITILQLMLSIHLLNVKFQKNVINFLTFLLFAVGVLGYNFLMECKTFYFSIYVFISVIVNIILAMSNLLSIKNQ